MIYNYNFKSRRLGRNIKKKYKKYNTEERLTEKKAYRRKDERLGQERRKIKKDLQPVEKRLVRV